MQKRLRGVVERAVELDSETMHGAFCDISNPANDLIGAEPAAQRTVGGAVEFIRALEAVLFYFIETGFAVPSSAVPEALKACLLTPVEVFTEIYHQALTGINNLYCILLYLPNILFILCRKRKFKLSATFPSTI